MITALGNKVGSRFVAQGAASRFCLREPHAAVRFLSSKSGGGDPSRKSFRPSRRPSRNYRPVSPLVTKTKKQLELDEKANANNPLYEAISPVTVDLDKVSEYDDELESTFGPLQAGVLRSIRQEVDRKKSGELKDEVEEDLRMADYLTAELGSTEDLVFARRLLAAGIPDEKERKKYVAELAALIEKKQEEDVLGEYLHDTKQRDVEKQTPIFQSHQDDDEEGDFDPEVFLDPNQLAHGEWSEMLVTVDRTTKLWRGGRLESYRALVIGGNLNGCGGFGIGKSKDPINAVAVASRKCKRNIFFVDRYQGNGLTSDLAGKQNSCKVYLRSTDDGLRGNHLIREILKRFGITNCVAKSHGNRNPYNVTRATFKALMTHESIEDIALKRGKRLVSIDRAMRMQV
ncbi:small subunit ribosomal protein S5 [Fistulifera solaris]|uniref:Small subunit ribosomal protein S5 n=1 Tax=Fistulifera solaris TaxID=1519565 RepID=A0A1Z5K7E2_FISSO|nr:small subunit ribosomal protein S5 [Fistulifera solaris]|eukprot:GAX22149.1 small subunit ribosomal protein S5 [Fistulifera solaris]